MKKYLVFFYLINLSIASPFAFSFKPNGFYVGANLGVTNFTTNYRNTYNFSGTDSLFAPLRSSYSNKFNTSVSAPLFTPGILLGYQKTYVDAYVLGGELAVKYNGGRTASADQTTDAFSYSPIALQENDFRTTAALHYNIDFLLKPGLFMTDTVLSYLKVGVTFAHLDTNLTNTHNNALIFESFSISNGNSDKNIWGFIVGMGLEKAISSSVSIFGEYSFSIYERANLRTVFLSEGGLSGAPSTITSTSTYQRVVNPYDNRFNLGVRYYL